METKTFEQMKADREAVAQKRFNATMKKMDEAARAFVNREIDDKELSAILSGTDVTKLALYIWIIRDLRRRIVPGGVR